MRTSRTNSIGLPYGQAHLLLRFTCKNSYRSVDNVECVLHIAVVMPGYDLRWADLQLGDAEAGPRGVVGATFNFIVPTCALSRLHGGSLLFCGIARRRSSSLWSDVGRSDHLAPLLDFLRDELSEIGGRAAEHRAVQVGKPRLHLGVGEARIDLLVELVDDLGGRGLWVAEAQQRARFVA